MRKPIQISVTDVANTQATQCHYVCVVICDDGTIWENDDSHPEWRELPPIPQTKLTEQFQERTK